MKTCNSMNLVTGILHSTELKSLHLDLYPSLLGALMRPKTTQTCYSDKLAFCSNIYAYSLTGTVMQKLRITEVRH